MLGIGSEELLIIIIFSILVFDPDKLPEAGRRLGRALRHLRKTKQDVSDVVQKEVIRPLESAEDKVVSDVRKIEKSLEVGSFENLLADNKAPSVSKETKTEKKTSATSDGASGDCSVQKMADLLYGIDEGEEAKKDS